jgi:hypothetical protein
VPETKGQLKYLYQFNSIKTGAAIKTTLAIAAGLVKSSSSSSRSGSCESASKKQRTATTRDVTHLEAAAFLTEDKTDVLYGADALKEQQLYKQQKAAEAAKKALTGGPHYEAMWIAAKKRTKAAEEANIRMWIAETQQKAAAKSTATSSTPEEVALLLSLWSPRYMTRCS